MSVSFTIYSPLTGKVLRTGFCMDISTADLQVENDEAILYESAPPGVYVSALHEFVALPEKPSEYHVFDYSTKTWEDPRTAASQWPIVRAERNQRLQSTDWTQLADILQETKILWEPYRQALRDITTQPDPFNIVWPTPPQG